MTPAPITRRRRVFEMIPLAAALILYGDMHDRWLLAVPLLLLLFIGWATEWELRERTWLFYTTVVSGMAAGFLLLSFSEPPTVAIPSSVASIAGGGLATLATYFALCRRPHSAWTAAWVLAAVALQVPSSVGAPARLPWMLFAFLASTMLGVFFTESPASGVRSRNLGYLGFAICLVPACIGLIFAVIGTDNWILHSIEQYAKDIVPQSGLGLQSRMDLRAFSHIDQSSQIVFELDGTPPDRLRTTVLDKFDGASWFNIESSGDGSHRPRYAPARILAPPPPEASLQKSLEIMILAPFGGIVPTPAGTWGLLGTRGSVEAGWIWRTPGTIPQPFVIETSALERLPPEPPPDATMTDLPADLREPFAAIARDVVGDARTPGERAERIRHFFQSQFEYSLTTDLRAKGTNILLVMIRERRPAYCIYFASAMAALLRSIDIKARVIGGFVPGDRNPITGRYDVRSADAHAWVEAYIPEEGRWVPFDPTPSQGREDSLFKMKSGLAHAFFEAVKSAAWRTWLSLRQDPLGWVKAIGRSRTTWALLGLFILWRYWRGRGERAEIRRLKPLASNDPALLSAYASYLRLLRSADVIAGPGETDDEILARLHGTCGPEAATAARVFVDRYARCRFGGQTTRSEELVSALDALRKTLKTKRAA